VKRYTVSELAEAFVNIEGSSRARSESVYHRSLISPALPAENTPTGKYRWFSSMGKLMVCDLSGLCAYAMAFNHRIPKPSTPEKPEEDWIFHPAFE
jgi:hypothetical protein